MREKLNSNPVVQAAVIGVLGIAVAFLVFTRVISQGGGAPPPATTPDQSAAAPSAASTTPTTEAVPPDPAPTVAPETTAPAAEAPSAGAAPDEGAFVAGPGLPKEVAAAHDDGKVIVLLVVRDSARDDRRLRAVAEKVRSRVDTELFVVKSADIAEYSRITQGVRVDRTPALVVVEPKRLARDDLPEASISYGYRGIDSVAQAINDALYKGKENLPYYP